jgi:hypothetical protein
MAIKADHQAVEKNSIRKLQVVSINNLNQSKRSQTCVKQADLDRTCAGSNRRSCSAWSHADMPNKPEVMLRIDDLLNTRCNGSLCAASLSHTE